VLYDGGHAQHSERPPNFDGAVGFVEATILWRTQFSCCEVCILPEGNFCYWM